MGNGKSTIEFFQNYSTNVKLDDNAKPAYRDIARELLKGNSVTCFLDGKIVVVRLDSSRNVVVEEKKTTK